MSPSEIISAISELRQLMAHGATSWKLRELAEKKIESLIALL